MKLSRIHHIAIIATDYELAKDFYINKLGFEIRYRVPTWSNNGQLRNIVL